MKYCFWVTLNNYIAKICLVIVEFENLATLTLQKWRFENLPTSFN